MTTYFYDGYCQSNHSDSVHTFISKQIRKQSTNESIFLTDGKIYISGKPSNKQIFIEKNKVKIQLSNFTPFETINEIKLSFDGTMLLVYHKKNNAIAFELSVFDVMTKSLKVSIFPGYGGNLNWTANNNILHEWGCGSECVNFKIYDSNLNVIANGSGSGFTELIDQDIIISLPYKYFDKGKFKIFSLTTGKMIFEKDFSDLYGEYYCYEVKPEGNVLKAVLDLANEDNKKVTVTIVYQNK